MVSTFYSVVAAEIFDLTIGSAIGATIGAGAGTGVGVGAVFGAGAVVYFAIDAGSDGDGAVADEGVYSET